MTNKNYGIKGGETDPTKHLVVAVPKLLNKEEFAHWSRGVAVAAATQTERKQASNN